MILIQHMVIATLSSNTNQITISIIQKLLLTVFSRVALALSGVDEMHMTKFVVSYSSHRFLNYSPYAIQSFNLFQNSCIFCEHRCFIDSKCQLRMTSCYSNWLIALREKPKFLWTRRLIFQNQPFTGCKFFL